MPHPSVASPGAGPRGGFPYLVTGAASLDIGCARGWSLAWNRRFMCSMSSGVRPRAEGERGAGGVDLIELRPGAQGAQVLSRDAQPCGQGRSRV